MSYPVNARGEIMTPYIAFVVVPLIKAPAEECQLGNCHLYRSYPPPSSISAAKGQGRWQTIELCKPRSQNYRISPPLLGPPHSPAQHIFNITSPTHSFMPCPNSSPVKPSLSLRSRWVLYGSSRGRLPKLNRTICCSGRGHETVLDLNVTCHLDGRELVLCWGRQAVYLRFIHVFRWIWYSREGTCWGFTRRALCCTL